MRLDCSVKTQLNVVFLPAVMSDLFKASDGCQDFAHFFFFYQNHRHIQTHDQLNMHVNRCTRGTCSLDAFTLQSLTLLTASQDVGCSFSQLCLHIFSGSNRESVGMKGVGVEKKRLSSSAFAICGGLRGENIALQRSAAQIK